MIRVASPYIDSTPPQLWQFVGGARLRSHSRRRACGRGHPGLPDEERRFRGAWLLHNLKRADPLETFITFSSISVVGGIPGQAAYGAANAYMDALMSSCSRRCLLGNSIQWPAVSDVMPSSTADGDRRINVIRLEWCPERVCCVGNAPAARPRRPP
jgi:hypothetical protein